MIKRGASLIWAMVISTALLFIASTVAGFVIDESKMSIRMDDSSRAYAAAESGIEWGKYCIQALNECDADSYISPLFYVGASEYRVSVTRVGSELKIESLGISNGVNRKLEYIISTTTTLQPVSAPDDITPNLSIGGSYVQQFDYWTDGSASASIGIASADSAKIIYFEHTGGNVRLAAKSGETVTYSNSVNLSAAGITISDPYVLRVRIEYYKDFSAKMTILKQSFDGEVSIGCISGPLVVDLRSSGIAPSDLKRFYYAPVNPVSDTTVGDGSVYAMRQGAFTAYFDNMSMSGVTTGPKVLTVTKAGTGSGTVTSASILPLSSDAIDCGSDCTSTYDTSTTVVLTATPASGSYLAGWSGDCSASGGVTVNGIKNCTATFNILVPVPVYWFTSALEYFQSTNEFETGGGFYTKQGVSYNTPECSVPGTKSVTRYRNLGTGRHFWQIEETHEVTDGATWDYDGPSFCVFPIGTPGRTPVYRYYLPGTDAHLYSVSYGNPTYAGYTYEGEVWRVN